jgi:hypothetical protein
LLDWPIDEATLFVSIGTQEEREAAVRVLRESGHRFALDLLTIAELTNRKSFDAAIKLLGRPLIPQTVRERLLVLIQLVGKRRPSGSLTEHNGQLQITETSPRYYEHREAFLREMLRCVDHYCDVVPTAGPHEITDFHRSLAQALDNDTLDVLYLCLERNAVLVSDDASLRLLAPAAGITISMGVQPVLMEACDKDFLSKDAYVDAVVGKLVAGHDFVSVRSQDLFTLAKRTPARVSEDAKIALDTFRKPTLDIASGVQVSCEFLMQAIQRLQPTVAAAYGKHILEALQHERPLLHRDIHQAVANVVQETLQRTGRKLKLRERKVFEPLLNVPDPIVSVRYSPLTAAIRESLRKPN